VKTPLDEIVPMLELPPCTPDTYQFTPVLLVPETVAANVCDWPPATVAAAGEITTLIAWAAIVSDKGDEALAAAESFTVIEAVCVPAAVGVPVIVPVLPMERPLGSPLAVQL
jgi:hypothetical protein